MTATFIRVALALTTAGLSALAIAERGASSGAAVGRLEAQGEKARFGFGRVATPEEIRRADTDVTPNGDGLPRDRGSVTEGAALYKARCASCHGSTGVEGPQNQLVGREPADSFPYGRDPELLGRRTIGSYWPYATTLYDYINRAMPQDAPGSLRPHDVYAVVAYLLYRNNIVKSDAIMSDETLPRVRMPARYRFVPDNRRGGSVIR